MARARENGSYRGVWPKIQGVIQRKSLPWLTGAPGDFLITGLRHLKTTYNEYQDECNIDGYQESVRHG